MLRHFYIDLYSIKEIPMTKLLLSICLTFNLLYSTLGAQDCEITAVTAVALPCQSNNFSVSVNLMVNNPSSPGFTLAGNGVIYGTYLYSDLPVVVGPLLGDDESLYEFIAWDVENADCQQYTTIAAENCGPICSFSNFELDSISCVGNQSALVVFDFDYQNPPGLTFDLFNEDGEFIKTYLYQSLPITEPFFIVNGAAPIILTVCDHLDNSCCETFVLDAIDCNPNNCEIFSVTVDPECTGSNFLVHLDFEYDNPASDSFKVTGNNLSYGTFPYDSLPITLGPLNGNSNINWQFLIEDKGNPACNALEVLGIYHCPPPCDVLAMEALALECFGNEAYALEIGIEIEGEGDLGFAVFSETGYYGNYMYNQLPITIPAFEGSGDFVDIVSVCDNENLGCCSTAPFEALLCAGCLIYNLTATPLPCNAEDEIFVQIDFDHQNTSTEGFEISGNGNNYGQFSYEDLPVQVGPFVGDGSQYFEFIVTDIVNSLCFEAVELGFIDCDTICELTNLVVETGTCTGNNTYVLHVNFDYQGVSGVGFDLFANGELYGFYSYGQLPLTIEEFPSNGTGTDVIMVCENESPLCCATLSFDAPDCACTIFDATAENLGCNTDSTFGISLEFFYENLPGNSVDVFLDGVLIGFYNIEDIPLILDIPEGDGSAVLTVCANGLNNCCADVVIELMQCVTPQCGIFDLIAETGDCNSDSTFLLDLVFEHMNLPTDSITVTANGTFVGQYLIQPEFNRIENFPALEADTTIITVCAVGAPDCCDTYSIVTPDCSLFGQCQIYDLIADVGDCTSDSTYILQFEFNSINLDIDSVIVTGNGNYIGQFPVNSQNILIEQFPVFDDTITTLVVCAVGAPDCCDSFEFETPDCSLFGQCQIWDLVTDVGECTSDTTFILYIAFNSVNMPGDSVVVTANGNTIGIYEVNPDGLIIQNFPVLDSAITVLTVCASGDPECCATTQFETPTIDCGEECNIFDLEADPGSCNGDSTYSLFVHYFAANLSSDSVVVSTSEGFTGHFAHHPEGFTIPAFPAYNTSHTTITLCALGSEDCCDVFEFETPDCGQVFVCEFYNLFAEVGECTSDSTYVLDVVFVEYNLPGDSVYIFANSEFVGTYFNEPDFIHILDFPHQPGEQTILTVCAVGAVDCCASYTFETPSCSGDCIISEIVVDIQDCTSDSTFGLFVNFHHENLPGGFDIYAGDEYLGFFSLEQIPANISNFPANETGNYVITICENDGTTCCTSLEFNGPLCGSNACDILNLGYTLTACDSADNFYFILDFDFVNIGDEGFNVVGNGNEYGNFSYENVPVQIGPFPSDDTDYEFLVFDDANPGCFQVINPGVVECLVSTTPVDYDQFFAVFNNGSVPGIYARKDVLLSVYNANGKNVLYQLPLSADEIYALKTQPAGLYMATIMHGKNIWPVKLVKSGN